MPDAAASHRATTVSHAQPHTATTAAAGTAAVRYAHAVVASTVPVDIATAGIAVGVGRHMRRRHGPPVLRIVRRAMRAREAVSTVATVRVAHEARLALLWDATLIEEPSAHPHLRFEVALAAHRARVASLLRVLRDVVMVVHHRQSPTSATATVAVVVVAVAGCGRALLPRSRPPSPRRVAVRVGLWLAGLVGGEARAFDRAQPRDARLLLLAVKRRAGRRPKVGARLLLHPSVDVRHGAVVTVDFGGVCRQCQADSASLG
mmetsp:Transcript_15370/g.35637  ORF Transcript_15370/g.35637 Transcript_15370/m.35637 type:complete len:261 (+) Transcript_15370:1284-2066(+)